MYDFGVGQMVMLLKIRKFAHAVERAISSCTESL